MHGNTILHFPAIDGNASAFKQLFEDGLLTSEMLKNGNLRGDTTLHEAARFGRCNVVEILLEKDEGLALERNSLGETSLYVAVASGKKDVFDFVKGKLNRDNVTTTRNDGCTLLHAAVIGESYSKCLFLTTQVVALALDSKKYNFTWGLSSHVEQD